MNDINPMIRLMLLLTLCLATQASANPDRAITEEWRKLREELRMQGYPVNPHAKTPREIAADMERTRWAMQRARWDMERRGGRIPVSDRQRIGGGGGPAAARNSDSRARLQPARGLR
jgi:hypothetical protein